MKRIKLDADQLDWQPAHDVWPGYALEGTDGADPSGAGVFLKVLRRPEDGGGCWCALLRFSPPPGHAIRISAIAASDEEVFILSHGAGGSDVADVARSAHGAPGGTFTCNPKELRHGNTFVDDTVAFVHYHGDPDQVLKAEVVLVGDQGR